MLNQIRKFKFHDGRFTSAANFFLLQCNYSANAPEKESDLESFSAVYLRNEHGVSEKQVISYSKHLKFNSLGKPLSVIAFLKNHHFNDSQISTIVKKWPMVFRYVPETSFVPKIEYLGDLGFSSSDIVKILTLKPNLLDRSLDGQIIPCVNFLRSFLHSDKDIMFSILRYPGILRENLHNTLLPNVEILREAGVPESHIEALLKTNPRRISVDPKCFRSTVEEVLRLGFDPLTMTFITGLMVMRQLSRASWRDKIEYYTRWGWSEDQVLDVIRKNPRIMAVSKDKIARILDFIIQTMKCDASIFMTRSGLLLLSFEKRIVPRCAFYRVLLARGLVKKTSLWALLLCPEGLFLDRYLLRFQDRDPDLLHHYEKIFTKAKL